MDQFGNNTEQKQKNSLARKKIPVIIGLFVILLAAAGISIKGQSFKAHAAVCGDGVQGGGEECDDSNTVSGDGCSSVCTVESCLPQPGGLTDWWRAENNYLDYIGSMEGTPHATHPPAFTAGMVGQALSFDGSGWADVGGGGSTALNTANNSYTIAGWFKNPSGGSDFDFIQVYEATEWILPKISRTSGKIKAWSINNSVTGTTTLTADTWYHFANTWDAANGLRIFVDGELEASSPQATYPATGTNTGFFMKGVSSYLDEVMLFNRALSETEVAAIYNAGSAGLCTATTCAGLTGQYRQACLNVESSAPGFTVVTNDASTSSSPANNGVTDAVTFTATATDANSNNYYLLLCSDGSSATPNSNAAPSCLGGTQICVSASTASGAPATCYGTAGTSAESVDWESFVCDHSADSKCSATETTNSPYYVNHKPEFTAVAEDDGTVGHSIEPGETITFRAAVTETDTNGGADTVNLYICTDGSAYGGIGDPCGEGAEICSSLSQIPGDVSCNASPTLTGVPTAHGNYDYEVFVADSHDFAATESSAQQYAVTDVAPVIDSFGTHDAYELTAGTTTNLEWTANVHDNNGDGDLVSASGKFFDPPETSACDPSTSTNPNAQTECYADTSCDISTAYGTNVQAQLTCGFTTYFNANAVSDWTGYISVLDGSNPATTGSSGAILYTISGLLALDIRDNADITTTIINYGSVATGGNTGTSNQSVYIANMGNQAIDTYVFGSNMCNNWGTPYSSCGGSTLPVTNQKWFQFPGQAYASGAPLQLEASKSCLNNDIPVRTINTQSAYNDPVYLGIGIPAGLASGLYTGQNTFSAAAASTCP